MNAIIKPPMPGMGILRPTNVQELDIFAQRAAMSGMVPPQYDKKPGAIFVAVQFGSELGLSPMQSLINIAVVNGRPTLFADAMIGLCRQSSVCEDIKEWYEGDGDTLTAWCEARRHGASPVRQSFSVADAKKAGLWGKAGPWTQYPKRMMQWRARSWACRDAFPDVLRGLTAYEEALDIPRGGQPEWTGPSIDARPEPPPQPTPPQPTPPQPDHPKAEAYSRRDEINRAVPIPPAPPKRTARQWLDDLRMRVDQCQTSDDLDLIATSADVRKAQQHLKNGALDELNAIFADAVERLAEHSPEPSEPSEPIDDDVFPGDRADA